LLEVLIALVIFSFGFVSLTELFSLGLQSIRKSEDVSQSVLIARDHLETLLLDRDLSPGEVKGVTENGYRWTHVVEEADLFGEENENSVEAYRIEVIVAPPKGGAYSLETLKVVNPDERES
jgi:hypothetical protein